MREKMGVSGLEFVCIRRDAAKTGRLNMRKRDTHATKFSQVAAISDAEANEKRMERQRRQRKVLFKSKRRTGATSLCYPYTKYRRTRMCWVAACKTILPLSQVDEA